MPNHEDAQRQLEAAQQQVANLAKVPETDEDLKVGTILTWQSSRRNVPHVAIRTNNGWAVDRTSNYLTWDQMCAMFFSDSGGTLIYLKRATVYESVMVEPQDPPQVMHISSAPHWIIEDADTGKRWSFDAEESQWIYIGTKQ